PGVLGRLALAVVEVRRHGDDRLGDLFAQVVLGRLLHLAQDLRRDLRRRELLVADLDPRVAVVGGDDLVGHQVDVLLDLFFLELAPDQALGREDRVARIGDRLALGRRADEDFAILEVGDDRRRGPRAFRVLDDLGLVTLDDGDTGVGRPQVNPD